MEKIIILNKSMDPQMLVQFLAWDTEDIAVISVDEDGNIQILKGENFDVSQMDDGEVGQVILQAFCT